jgi:hypothetical protein
MRWTVHPAAHHKGLAFVVVLVILLATVLTWSLTRWIWMTALAPLFLLVSLRAFFLPRTYSLDDDGAHEEGPLQAARHLAWADVRRVSRVRHGVHLSPIHSNSRFVRDRGVFLRTEENTESVADFVLSRRPAT